MFLLAAVDTERVTPGLLGFGVTVLLGLATWLLLRSMNRHLKRVDFPEDPAPSDSPTPPARSHQARSAVPIRDQPPATRRGDPGGA